jgi:hypothetical protein
MSLYLPEQKLGSHSTEGSSSNKFMLKGRQTGSMHRGHSWVFRAESFETMLAWFEDITVLTEKSPQERNAFVRQHARSVSGSSQRPGSISSDGIMDEEDDEPFSASASAVAVQGPKKQDVLPKRPQPGGRFPSADLIVNPDRGLQAPLSPSSGSSGFGDVQDRDVASASALPGSEIGHYYAVDASTSPTHAAMVNHYAQQDGINPYTSQQIRHQHESQSPPEQAVAEVTAGLGGAFFGPVGSQVYHHHEKTEGAKLEDQDALGSTKVAALDTDLADIEAQSAREAALVCSPDTQYEIKSNEKLVSDGRIPGDLLVVATGVMTDSYSGQAADVQPWDSSSPIEAVLSSLPQDTRPTLTAGQNHQSVQSISQLHIPGEFPKQATA